jgi:hypothetical protein
MAARPPPRAPRALPCPVACRGDRPAAPHPAPRPSPSPRRAARRVPPSRAPPRVAPPASPAPAEPLPASCPLSEPLPGCAPPACRSPSRALGCAPAVPSAACLGRAPGCALACPCLSPCLAASRPTRLARFACPRHAQRALTRATVVAFRLTLV